jgi:S-adenosylmethionine:tRNA ribosyltransferase-isomerase
MKLDVLDYDLPPELIAQEPLADRSASRMLVLHRSSGQLEHRSFRDFPSYMRPGDLLVLNDTRVTAVRLQGHRPTGGGVEVLLMKEIEPNTYDAVVRPAKRLRPGATVEFGDGLAAEVVAVIGEMTRSLHFPEGSQTEIRRQGSVPLPPYIHQKLENPDRYQTVYSRAGGSAAAPTAGLHFTPEIFAELEAGGVELARVTLDVGLDTFRPMSVEDSADHPMHGERCAVSVETAGRVNACKGRVIAVGTTSVRTLESFAIGSGDVRTGEHVTDILIQPGYSFQIVNGMLTNFHMPRTTMLLMLAALSSVDSVKMAYAEAVQHQYRFLSFGDCMLIV